VCSILLNAVSCAPVNQLSDEEMRQLTQMGCGLQIGLGVVFNTIHAKKGEASVMFKRGGVGFGSMWLSRFQDVLP
jgi:Zn-dependent alcohol dehydrogenase